jgi:hypothetical protein
MEEGELEKDGMGMEAAEEKTQRTLQFQRSLHLSLEQEGNIVSRGFHTIHNPRNNSKM